MKLFRRDKRIFFHVYVVFTLLAILTMFLEQKIARLLFTIGAGSLNMGSTAKVVISGPDGKKYTMPRQMNGKISSLQAQMI